MGPGESTEAGLRRLLPKQQVRSRSPGKQVGLPPAASGSPPPGGDALEPGLGVGAELESSGGRGGGGSGPLGLGIQPPCDLS